MYFKCSFKKNYSIQNGRLSLLTKFILVIHLDTGVDFQFLHGASKQTENM